MNAGASERVTIDELLGIHAEARQQALYTAAPASVQSYDRSKGTVKVSYPVGRMVPDGAGNFVLEPEPDMDDVPVLWMRTKKFAMTLPIEAGDSGLVVFCMRNPGAWRTTGAYGSPGDVGMHTIDGAVFIPGFLPDASPPKAAAASDMVLGSESDAKGRIVCKTAGLELGAGATKGVILANDKTTADTTMAAFITATIAAFTVIQGAIGAVVVPTAPTDFGKNGSGSASTKAL